MHLYIPFTIVSLILNTKDDTTITIGQITTSSGVTLLSIHGQFDDVQQFALAQDWDPAAIVADGDNAGALTDNADKGELLRQMIVIENSGNLSLNNAQTSITEFDLTSLKDDRLGFGHFIAAMDEGVNIIGWVSQYDGQWVKYATTQRLAFYIDPVSRTIRNSQAGGRTVLLIGDPGSRTLLGQLSNEGSSIKVVTSNFNANIQVRQDATAGYLVEVEFGGGTVHVVSAQNLALYLSDTTDTITWFEASISGRIEEVAAIAGQDIVLLTLMEGEYRYVPFTVAIQDDRLAFIPSTQYGVKVEDFGDTFIGAPIIRAHPNGNMVMISRNNGSPSVVVDFYGSAALDQRPGGIAMRRMIDAATNNELSVAA